MAELLVVKDLPKLPPIHGLAAGGAAIEVIRLRDARCRD